MLAQYSMSAFVLIHVCSLHRKYQMHFIKVKVYLKITDSKTYKLFSKQTVFLQTNVFYKQTKQFTPQITYLSYFLELDTDVNI